jgi:23S rRNA pseudouridine2604 synthase
MEKGIFPMRINKYLALQNVCTRREADALIQKGAVTVNGVTATVGMKVHQKDKVEVAHKAISDRHAEYVYFAYNKPVGVVTNPEKGHQNITQTLHIKEKVFPVGRLDKASHGLIILTNDGRITDKLLNPKYDHEKEYLVTVDKTVPSELLRRLQIGVYIEGYKTQRCRATKAGDKSFYLTLNEGKKHQIRRMCAVLGYNVIDLQRVRIMNIELADLPIGRFEKLEGKELNLFLKQLGIMP